MTWSTTSGNQSELHYRRRLPAAGSFTPDRVLPVAAAGLDFGGNYVVQDPAPSNRLVLVTQRCCQTPTTYALTSTDGGASWTAARPVYEGNLAVNQTDGRVSLVANGPSGIWLMQGNPDIRTVLLPSALDTVVPLSAAVLLASAAPYDGGVALDERGQPVFAFGDLVRTFVRRGLQGRDILAGNYANIGNSTIKIAGGPRGVVALVTGGTPGRANFLETRKLNGDVLAAPVRLTAAADASPRVPFITADQTGRFHVVWRGPGSAVLYRRSDSGTGWGVASTLVAAGGSVFDLVASAGPNGTGWIVWNNGSGSSGIFAAPLAGTVGPTPPPPPVAGRSVNVAVVSGTVRVRLRGTSRFVDLRQARQIPVGSELDTTRGRVRLTSAAAARRTQSGIFYDGRFVVGQRRTGTRLTELRLSGPLGCPRTTSAAAQAPRKRRLWGNAKGSFRTRGRYASAAVRGTVWLTEDTCRGTLLRVRTGRLEVLDLVRGRRILLGPGQSYLARPR